MPTTAAVQSSVVSPLAASQPGAKAPGPHGKAERGLSFAQLFAEHTLPLENERGGVAAGKPQEASADTQPFAKSLPEQGKTAPVIESAQPAPGLPPNSAINSVAAQKVEVALPQPADSLQAMKGEPKDALPDSLQMSSAKPEKKQPVHSSPSVSSSASSVPLRHDFSISPQPAPEVPPANAAAVRHAVPVSEPVLPALPSANPAGMPPLPASAAASAIASTMAGQISGHPAVAATSAEQAVPGVSADKQPFSQQSPSRQDVPLQGVSTASSLQADSASSASAPVSELGKTLKAGSATAGAEDAKSGAQISIPIPVQASSAAILHGNQDGERFVAGAAVPDGGPLAGANHAVRGEGVVAGREVNPYQHLDQASEPVVLRADASRVAVGVHDASLGWVEVKAQSAAGQVSASLVAASEQTHASLVGQMPALSQFLSESHVRVDHLQVDHSGAERSGVDQQQPGGGEQRRGEENRGTSEGAGNQSEAASLPVVARGRSGSEGAADSEGAPLSYISVRA